MQFGNDNNRLMSDINVTPFVDVMLVLLIIFMVTAPMMVQGVNVSLPQTTATPLPAENDQLIVSIDKQHQVHINDLNVSLDFLREKLGKIMEKNPDRNVYLRADKDISYGMVVQVMAEIKEAGVEKLGMVTEPPDKTEKLKKQ